ncbi:MAG: gliding motility-associated C-terminal domain-containing protein [Bacteroidota bacterium]
MKILNNTFGADYSKSIPLKCGYVSISGSSDLGPTPVVDLITTVSGNTFNNPAYVGSNSCHGMLFISNIAAFITIRGNKIGHLSNWFSCQTTGIGIVNCENGIIGGPNPEDQNIISVNFVTGISLNNNRNMTIQKNSLFCNFKGINAVSAKVAIPDVKIMSENGTDQLGGTATPDCKIELFQTPQCSGCDNGEIYLGETISDNNGNWNFTGAFNNAVSARATTAAGVSGEFSSPKFVQSFNYTEPSCGQNNGSIPGTQFISGTRYYWVRNLNGNTDTIFNQLDLVNIGPGLYTFVVEQTAYCTKSYSIYLADRSPVINEQFVSVTHPSCGLANGNILSINATGSYNKVYWLSESRDTVSTSLNLLNVAPGKYKLIVMNTEYGCGDSTELYTLVNQSGPSLNTANVQVTDATCNNSDGSIANITTNNVTGSPFIQWIDSLNNVVGNSLDLLNQPAGKYKLKFKDQSGCDTIITPFYVIPVTGRITIDTAGKIIKTAGCRVNNGSIRNTHVTGADTYLWQNLTTNTPAGNTIDISNLSAGNYQLTATNTLGCSATSPVISVPSSVFIPIGVTGSFLRNAICGENNGILRNTSFNNDSNYYSFRWTDSATNQQIGTGTSIYSLGAGTYFFHATDSNGCEKQIFKGIIGAFPKPVFDLSVMKIDNDKCSRTEGKIKGINITGLLGPATTYTWRDINNNIVSNTIDLLNVAAGQYYLTVIDGGLCTIQSAPFTIINTNDPGIILQYDDQMIPRNTSASLIIKNFQPGSYFLYSDPGGTQLLQQNTTGVFTTGPLSADGDYYIKFVSGACTSSIVHVKITVVDKSFFAIASGFTPNNDGINDRLNLKIIGYIDVEYFRIFNRNGEEVFFTKTVNEGWNGRFKGMEQPASIFVWIAKGKDINGNTITDKGIFLLIR